MVKRQRRKVKAVKIRNTSTAKQDLISRLPDEVLTHTLSFLPTKSAVATSLLSKRWKDVWISVPNLDFCHSWPPCPVKRDLLFNFIDRVLSLNNVSFVRKIYLHCEYFADSRGNAWISLIARRDAEEFNLNLYGQIYSILPDSFFHKEKLVKLILEQLVLKVPPLVCFPNLKSIQLFSIQFSDDDSLKNLLFGCPILWSLDISLEWMDKAHVLYINSATLHKLDIHSVCRDDDLSFKCVIDAPNLSILHITDFYEPSSYEIINVSSLTTATLRLEPRNEILIDVFADISHVRDLSLHAWSSLIHTLPMFHNLVRFELGFVIGWDVLPLMFNCMPKLVTFILDLSDQEQTPCAWCDPIEVPHCFLYCIENVEITHLDEGGQAIQMIAYILKNATALKNLVIRPVPMEFDDEKKFLKALLNLPRSSMACQIDYAESVYY